MSAERFESFLARLYVDEDLRRRFVADPRATAAETGLSERDVDALAEIDLDGLELAARSYASKRNAKTRVRRPGRWWSTMFGVREG